MLRAPHFYSLDKTRLLFSSSSSSGVLWITLMRITHVQLLIHLYRVKFSPTTPDHDVHISCWLVTHHHVPSSSSYIAYSLTLNTYYLTFISFSVYSGRFLSASPPFCVKLLAKANKKLSYPQKKNTCGYNLHFIFIVSLYLYDSHGCVYIQGVNPIVIMEQDA